MIKWLTALADRISQRQSSRPLLRFAAWGVVICAIGLFTSMSAEQRATLRTFWLMTALLLAASLAYVKSLQPNRYLVVARLLISLTAIFAAVMCMHSN